MNFQSASRVYKERYSIWKPLGLSKVKKLRCDTTCTLCKSLVPLCYVSQWMRFTVQFFLSVNFTEDNNRDRGQLIYPAWRLCSNAWGSHSAFWVADSEGWNKSHLHTTHREDFSLVEFTLFVSYKSLPLNQPRWADGKQFRRAQKHFRKMKIFSG